MPNFLPMLRARNAFSNRNFGMPSIDNTSGSDILAEAASAANDMKLQDMNRAKEMMLFQTRLQAQNEARQESNRLLEQNRRTVFGPANKQRVVQIAPLTSMQQKFKQEEDEARENKFRMGQLAAAEQGRMATALATGKQREEGDTARLTASLNAQREEGTASRASAEKIAGSKAQAEVDQREDQQKFTADENRLNRENKGGIFQTTDKNGKPVTVKEVNGKFKRVQLDDEDIGVTKPGTPSKLTQPPREALEDARATAQDTLNEISKLVGDDNQLTDVGKWATGATGHLGKLPFTSSTSVGSGQASIKKIQARNIVSLIEKMKNQSRTGATGFGAMNLKELGVLENAASKLSDPTLPEKDIQEELINIRTQLRLLMQDEPDEDNSKSDKSGSSKMSVADLRKKYER